MLKAPTPKEAGQKNWQTNSVAIHSEPDRILLMSNQIDLIQAAIAEIVAKRGAVTIGHLHMLVAERLMEDYHMTLEIMEAAGQIQLDAELVRRASCSSGSELS